MTWKDTRQGLYHSGMVLQCLFLVSVFAYVWHLSEPPKEALEHEHMVVRRLFLGPGYWAQPCDMWSLQGGWGFRTRLMPIQQKTNAAVARVCLKEDSVRGQAPPCGPATRTVQRGGQQAQLESLVRELLLLAPLPPVRAGQDLQHQPHSSVP